MWSVARDQRPALLALLDEAGYVYEWADQADQAA